MKVFMNNKVYVQKQDLDFLKSGMEYLKYPSSIFDNMEEKGINEPFYVNDSNKYDFVGFDKECEITFFKNCEWIIDFDSYIEMTNEELVNEISNLFKEGVNYSNSFNELPANIRKEKYSQMIEFMGLLIYKQSSIKQIYKYKNGDIDVIPLPKKEEEEKKEEKRKTTFQKVLKIFRKNK